MESETAIESRNKADDLIKKHFGGEKEFKEALQIMTIKSLQNNFLKICKSASSIFGGNNSDNTNNNNNNNTINNNKSADEDDDEEEDDSNDSSTSKEDAEQDHEAGEKPMK